MTRQSRSAASHPTATPRQHRINAGRVQKRPSQPVCPTRSETYDEEPSIDPTLASSFPTSVQSLVQMLTVLVHIICKRNTR